MKENQGRMLMNNIHVDIVVIGGGPAGLAAAISAKKNGAEKILILERNSWMGGILPQCIHDGFGVEEIGVSLTGPEYAEMYIKQAQKHQIAMMKETMVIQITKEKNLLAINSNGLFNINTKVIIFAMGCREKTRWNSMIAGTRPSGIYTAGVAQAFINLYNILPGKNVIILGSGDVGLIIARRLTFEGANVKGIIEILPQASGLPRNVVQCLDDYDIPLFLNHTIVNIEGKERVENVTIAQIDDQMNPIANTERIIHCDTVLLSLGLIPENELGKQIGICFDNSTGGPVVNQNFETSCNGFFACGNCLQVYDTVDMLSEDAKIAGRYAASKCMSETGNGFLQKSKIIAGAGVRYIIPQFVDRSGEVRLTFRVKKQRVNTKVQIYFGSKKVLSKKLPWVHPANMTRLTINIPKKVVDAGQDITVSVDEF
ncbi:MAG: FAD-dependent oxidoreductase [Thermoplasmatota archaeon]